MKQPGKGVTTEWSLGVILRVRGGEIRCIVTLLFLKSSWTDGARVCRRHTWLSAAGGVVSQGKGFLEGLGDRPGQHRRVNSEFQYLWRLKYIMNN